MHSIKHKQPDNPTLACNRFVSYISLPFNSQYDKITAILKQFNFCTLPIVKKSFNSVIKLGKDYTKKWDRTNLVYSFSCKSCPASYTGETKRSLKTRIKEHQKNNNPEAVVSQHKKEFCHDFDWENTKILDFEPNYKKRTLSEMIHIKCNKNNINKKEDVKSLNSSYFPLLVWSVDCVFRFLYMYLYVFHVFKHAAPLYMGASSRNGPPSAHDIL